LANQSTISIIHYLEDTQQGCLSSAVDQGTCWPYRHLDFQFAANLQFLSWGQLHFDLSLFAENLS
jgi:hypothetical protein